MKYNYEIDLEVDNSASLILRNIRPATKVLEFGPATGYMTKYMKDVLGCEVSCVEINSEAAEMAKSYTRKVVVGDLDDLRWINEFEQKYFDHIVFADVLEHLKNPWEVLRVAVQFLKDEGTVLTSIPNVGHVGLILDLIEGNFTYRPLGLLDNTHLRFFTRNSIMDLLRQCSLEPINVLCSFIYPEQTEFTKKLENYPKPLIDLLSSKPDPFVYQFIHISQKKEVVPVSFTIKETPSVFSKRTFMTQLFFDNGTGFREENSISIPVLEDHGARTFYFSNITQELPTIRWDPAEKDIAVRLMGISVIKGEGKATNLNLEGIYSHNGIDIGTPENPTIFFLGNDPQIYFFNEGFIGASSIAIEVQIIGVGEKLHTEFLMSKIQKIAQVETAVEDQRRELSRKDDRILQFEAEALTQQRVMSEKEHQIDQLRTAMQTQGRDIALCRDRIASLEVALKQEAAIKNAILNSTSWKLSSPIRLVGRIVKKIIRLFIWSWTHSLQLELIYHLNGSRDRYESTGNDPQFLLKSHRRFIGGCWAIISYHVSATSVPLDPRLYIDAGEGFSESTAISLPRVSRGRVKQFIRLPERVYALRLDPIDCPASFLLEKVAIQEIGKLRLGFMVLWYHLKWLSRSPQHMSTLVKVLGHLRHYSIFIIKHNLLESFLDRFSRETLEYRESLIVQRIKPKVNKVDVIIPVYRGLEETRACIESVLTAVTAISHEIIVINDSSPEPELISYLEALACKGDITLLHNIENLGFVGTVNRGMRLHLDRDVVLLNSDTEVASSWLDRLFSVAYANPHIATVTPFSNNATICSYPHFCESNRLPRGESAASLDAKFAAANTGEFVEIPTAVGFCMYIRRDCLNEVGLFDEEAFGKGYGEENDFCMRALQREWRHVLAADTFVYHAGSVSYGENNPLRQKATEVIRRRYPHYDYLVQRHISEDPARKYRLSVTARRFKESGLPVLLYVMHSVGGGTEKHIQDLSRMLGERLRILVLRPSGERTVLLESIDSMDGFSICCDPVLQYKELMEIITACNVSRIHVHHVLGHNLDFIRRLILNLALPFDFTVHDYYTVCPQINLVNEYGRYCGELGLSSCQACLEKRPASGGLDIESWRARHVWLVNEADRVIVPCEDVANRMRRYFPHREFLLSPHPDLSTVDFVPMVRSARLAGDEPLKILILGALVPHKGMYHFEACIRASNKACLSLEFHHLGHYQLTQADFTGCLMHGPYQEEDLQKYIDNIRPHVVWFPVQIPETFSYTLSAALRARLPVIAPNIGAFPERLSGRPWSWLVPWDLPADKMIEFFMTIRRDHFLSESPLQVHGEPAVIRSSFYEKDYLIISPVTIEEGSETSIHSPLIDLREKGKITILALLPTQPDGEPDPCAYIRVMLPLKHCAMRDRIRFRMVSQYSTFRYRADLLIVQRTAITDLQVAQMLIAHCRLNDIKVIYETDDDLFCLPLSHPERIYYEKVAVPARLFITHADEVIVSTSYLKRKLLALNPRVHVIPNALDETIWELAKREITPEVEKEQISILYMGTTTHAEDMQIVKEAIQRLQRDYGAQLKFDVIGIVPGSHGDWFNMLSVPPQVGRVYPQFIRWLLRQSRRRRWGIGVAPLADNDFNRCKSHIKYLDYAALGLPSIFSNLEPYRQIVEHERTGLLVSNTVEEWYRALKRLIDDPALRLRLGTQAQADLLTNHTLISQAGIRMKFWEDIHAMESQQAGADPDAAEVLSQYKFSGGLNTAIERIFRGRTPLEQNQTYKKNFLAIYDLLNRYRLFHTCFTVIPLAVRRRVGRWLRNESSRPVV